ncbi:MAG TPA: nucleotidyltransferase family protein [Dyadobacter sp.]|jgi:molybdenum cofactor cytidylyltransferase|nr:nucleotidyltransferase family protein [Dyadobacter sp.]
MNEDDHCYGLLILAAGNSSRLGEPKQLLPYKGKTLIANVVDSGITANLQPVIVVTGAYSESISPEIAHSSVIVIHNERWQDGMSSSIRAGISAAQKIPSLQGIILAVSDQPFVQSDLFLALIETAKSTRKGIVASFYDGTMGTPVLFDGQYFDALMNLKGAEGAKKLIKKFAEDVASTSFELGGIDIDTQEDYRKLTSRE